MNVFICLNTYVKYLRPSIKRNESLYQTFFIHFKFINFPMQITKCKGSFSGRHVRTMQQGFPVFKGIKESCGSVIKHRAQGIQPNYHTAA